MKELYDLMRSCEVKRWHTVSVSREQTVAEHQWAVTMIAVWLYSVVIGPPPEAFLYSCLLHDADEHATGDIPSPVKEFTIAEHATTKEQHILKIADAIEAFHFICNYGIGAHSDAVKDNCYKHLLGRCNRSTSLLGMEVLHRVDDALKALKLEARVF